MVRVGIVDDEAGSRERLREALACFEKEHKTAYEVREFECAGEFLRTRDNAFDILYLDIDMPGMSGMELAETIRQTDQAVTIIFCTNLEQFAVNGYKVGALGFIVKPVQQYSFDLYLRRALKAVEMQASLRGGAASRRIVVKDGTVSRVVDASWIEYVEVRKHYLIYQVRDPRTGQEATLRSRGSMQEVSERLSGYGFARCSASYLVNLSHITAVNRMDVYIGDEVIPIGRTFKGAFVREFARYLATKGWESPCC